MSKKGNRRLDPGNIGDVLLMSKIKTLNGKTLGELYQEELKKGNGITLNEVGENRPETKETLRKFGNNIGKGKFRNIRTEVEGEKFASMWEANCWRVLQDIEKAGLIRNLNHPHKRLNFIVAGIKIWSTQLDYEFDIPFLDENKNVLWQTVFGDAKGGPTSENRIFQTTLMMMKAFYPDKLVLLFYDRKVSAENIIKNIILPEVYNEIKK